MNQKLLIVAVLASLSLIACERATVVTPPPATVVVPGPPGPAGATGSQGATGNTGDAGQQGSQGNQGNDGNTGAAGKAGNGSTVIVMPPASAPAN